MRKNEKPFSKQMIPGDHIVRFYRDAKSGHPFMSISKNINVYYGHEMTTHPSLTKHGTIREGYVRLRKNPRAHDKARSYYHKSIKRITNLHEGNGKGRLSPRKHWRLSKRDLRRLKRIDKAKIKNVRLASDNH